MKKLIHPTIILCLACLFMFRSYGNMPSSCDRAKLHPLASNRPAINFFDGALLGNGGPGVVVTTREL